MALHPQSWLRDTLAVWFGYLLTAIAAILASAIGMLLINSGVGREISILISIILAVVGGFAAEWAILRVGRQRQLVLVTSTMSSGVTQLNLATPNVIATASFVVCVIASPAPTKPTVAVLPAFRQASGDVPSSMMGTSYVGNNSTR